MIITRNTARRLLGKTETVKAIPAFHALYEQYKEALSSPAAKGCCNGGVNTAAVTEVEKSTLRFIAGLSGENLDKLRVLLGDRKLYIYSKGAGEVQVLKELGKA